MRYKKCRCGEYTIFEENHSVPFICEKCGQPLGFESYAYRDDIIDKKTEKLLQTVYYLENEIDNYIIDIPDNADNVILGRDGLGTSKMNWGNNISRHHLQISIKNDNSTVIIVDTSTNGTRINERKIKPNRPEIVNINDKIVLDAILNDVILVLRKRGI